LQLLADVATTEADIKDVLFRPDGAQEGLRPEAAGSDRARTGSKPDRSWGEIGYEPETGRADLGRTRPPCSFRRRRGFKEKSQPEVRLEDLRRRARADVSGSNRGCRRHRQRYRSSSSDGGSDWGRESPRGRKRQPANHVGRNSEGRRYPSSSESKDRSASPIRRRRRTPTQNGSRESKKLQRPLRDRSTTSNQSHCKATDPRQTIGAGAQTE